jgi:hypothetical protein
MVNQRFLEGTVGLLTYTQFGRNRLYKPRRLCKRCQLHKNCPVFEFAAEFQCDADCQPGLANSACANQRHETDRPDECFHFQHLVLPSHETRRRLQYLSRIGIYWSRHAAGGKPTSVILIEPQGIGETAHSLGMWVAARAALEVGNSPPAQPGALGECLL